MKISTLKRDGENSLLKEGGRDPIKNYRYFNRSKIMYIKDMFSSMVEQKCIKKYQSVLCS